MARAEIISTALLMECPDWKCEDWPVTPFFTGNRGGCLLARITGAGEGAGVETAGEASTTDWRIGGRDLSLGLELSEPARTGTERYE